MDRAAAALLADAAEQAGVRRYLMVSSMGTDQADPDSDEVFQVYLRAKAAADEDLRGRDLDWTIVQPGRLTDDAGTGSISLDPGSAPREIPREDVAAVLLAALGDPATIRKQFTSSPAGPPSPRPSPASDEAATRRRSRNRVDHPHQVQEEIGPVVREGRTQAPNPRQGTPPPPGPPGVSRRRC